MVGPLRGFAGEGVSPVVHGPVAVWVGIAVAVRVGTARSVNGGGACRGVAVIVIVFVAVEVGVLGEVGETVVSGHGERIELRAGRNVGSNHVDFPRALSWIRQGDTTKVVEVVTDVGPRT